MGVQENKCEISQNDFLHVKFSEFYLCFHNSYEIWYWFSRVFWYFNGKTSGHKLYWFTLLFDFAGCLHASHGRRSKYSALSCKACDSFLFIINFTLDQIYSVTSFCYFVVNPFSPNIQIQILQTYLHKFTAAWLAQLGECRSAEREVARSNPGRTNTQGL